MKGTIYLIDNQENLQTLSEQPYASEDRLQTLLEKYPALLSGDSSDDDGEHRWLLIAREMGVPGEEGGSNRWSLDHLFLDREGIPTLVEVKRATDLRIRREVAGQMLDYAANAILHWPIESIRQRFEATCERAGVDSSETIESFLGLKANDADQVEAFWTQVKTNLQAGRIRMVFVADMIPVELRRIVEFLNSQMDPAEVLAVEVRQFVGAGVRTLVPRIIGQTAEAEQKKGSGARAKRRWDKESFLQTTESRLGTDCAVAARALLEWAERRQLRIWWGTGANDGSFFPTLDYAGNEYYTFSAWTYGSVELPLQHMRPPLFTDEWKRALLERVKAVPGLQLTHEDINRRPTFRLEVLKDQEARRKFIAAMEWVLEEIKAEV